MSWYAIIGVVLGLAMVAAILIAVWLEWR